jgi:tetratricopeptide (TPR) repeat protein
LDRALAIAPDDSETYFWKIQVPLFRDGDTAELSAAAADLPFEIAGRRPYGWIAAVYERDFQRALLELDDASIDLFEWQVQYVPKASYYGITYHLADQPALAREFFQDARYQLEAALQENPRDPRILLSLAEATAGLGESERAVDLALEAIDMLPTSADAVSGPWIHLDAILRVFTLANARELALDHLDQYFAGPGWQSIEGVIADPRLEGLVDDSGVQTLLSRYGPQ